MTAYYNENDPYVAQWLRNLISAGHIAPGDVDDRSIVDVKPDDLRGYTQCHFFAGIGGWSRALQLAGWPDDREVWSGSPPCQPFSVAGQRKGYDDDRHLAPKWLDLVRECRPAAVYGEQVAAAFSSKQWAWLDDLQDALEQEGYAAGAIVLPACCVGAPHIRQRGWFAGRRLGDGGQQGLERHGRHGDGIGEQRRHEAQPTGSASQGSPAGRVADGDGLQSEQPAGEGAVSGETPGRRSLGKSAGRSALSRSRPAGPTDSFWSAADWLYCRDGNWRPVEPGTFPLADGIPGRVGRLRAYGNAIVPEEAAQIILATME